MKVLREGKWEAKLECTSCRSLLLIEESDVRYTPRHEKQFTVPEVIPIYEPECFYATCEAKQNDKKCGHRIEIDRVILPVRMISSLMSNNAMWSQA